MSSNDPSWPTGDDGDEQGTPPPSEPASPPPNAPASPPPAPSSPTPAAAPASGIAGATLGVRFVARLIDGLIVGLATFVIGLVPGLDGFLISGIIGAALYIGYYAYFENDRGATFGKQAMSLQVVGADGGNPSYEESVKRNIFGAFQIVPILGGLASLVATIAIAVTINSAPDNRGVHDNFAGTTVLKV